MVRGKLRSDDAYGVLSYKQECSLQASGGTTFSPLLLFNFVVGRSPWSPLPFDLPSCPLSGLRFALFFFTPRYLQK